ncbi:ABC transporter permease [Kitasatospora sp. NPDC048540]|uniref:ABC transporter permease n=1 Tax=unclassified Kitasatospora TaxID=2633591 RepID=UPI00053B18EC|nr:ABC transporter permease [Kitasatospora sp. MBT63]
MSAYRALTGAAHRTAYRDKTTLFFTFAFPLIFLAIFGTIFRDEQPGADGLGAIAHIAPGVLSWGLANAAVFGTAFTLVQWRRDDLLRLIRLTPTTGRTLALSRYTTALTTAALQTLLFTGVALLPAFGLHLGPNWPLSIPVLLTGITTFLALGLVIGSIAATPEAVSALANFVMMPMAFFSGSWIPLDTLPGWIRTLSTVLPLRYLNEGLTRTIAGRTDYQHAAAACGALLLFTLLLSAAALRMFKWSDTP